MVLWVELGWPSSHVAGSSAINQTWMAEYEQARPAAGRAAMSLTIPLPTPPTQQVALTRRRQRMSCRTDGLWRSTQPASPTTTTRLRRRRSGTSPRPDERLLGELACVVVHQRPAFA